MRRNCKGTTAKGNPCKRTATVGDYCVAHTDDPEKSITKHLIPGPHPGGGRPKRPREIELIQEVAEEHKEKLRAVYVDGLVADRAVVVGNGPSAHVEVVPDHPHRLNTAKEIQDRLHGKPMQTIEGGGGGAFVNINLITDADLRAKAGDLRRRLAADRAIEPGWIDAGDGVQVDAAAAH